MEALDDMLGWDANRGDEKLSPAIDDDADQLVEFAFGVVVAE